MDIQKMIKDYTDWLNSGFTAVQVGEYYELTTPYLDRYNDHMQIYVKQLPNGSYLLTDDGNIITNLKSSGVSFSNAAKKRKDMLTRITRNFGVLIHGDALEIQSTKSDYPKKKHMLLQAMMTIDDMFVAEPIGTKNFFSEDVGLFLDAHNIYYSRDFSLVGRTGSLYVYDYHFQRTQTKPERFCKTINYLNENSRNLALFNWVDTRGHRIDASQLILFLNDEKGVQDSDLDAFQSYDVNYILWSEREKRSNLELLAA